MYTCAFSYIVTLYIHTYTFCSRALQENIYIYIHVHVPLPKFKHYVYVHVYTLCKGVRPSALDMLGSMPFSRSCLTEGRRREGGESREERERGSRNEDGKRSKRGRNRRTSKYALKLLIFPIPTSPFVISEVLCNMLIEVSSFWGS